MNQHHLPSDIVGLAKHGSVPDYRTSYRKEAAEDGWNRMVGCFKKYKVVA